jgi:phosphoglycerol transferase MdoB-like AlkP superfamily enzyme
MKNISRIFNHRFGLIPIVASIVLFLGFATRLVLLLMSKNHVEFNIINILGIFGIGLFYDLVVASFFSVPVALYCWLMKDNWYRHRLSLLLLIPLLLIITFILVLNAGGEIVFWDEFGARYNFIAVDYLVYTNEVIGNIRQSYNMPLIIGVSLLISIGFLWLFSHKIINTQKVVMRFGSRTMFFFIFLTVPLCAYFLVNNRFKNFSDNNYVNELSGAGIYEFGAAFWHNEIDYATYYSVNDEQENFTILREMLSDSTSIFDGDKLGVERQIVSLGKEQQRNVVMISMESFSADFMDYFGHQPPGLTPFLDSLTKESLFFSRFYATGTRTVRGLEALSLCIPPTPGQSIVRRPHNENMFTVGSVLLQKGYDVKYIYGGNSFFDNMGYFFGNSSYQVIDRKAFEEDSIQHETVWGVSDEDAFNRAIQECDKSFSNNKRFFNHIMTVSNHRPFTYPDGRIDIPSSSHTREGAVKYTDFAISKFIRDAAKKPWFNNTIFVIVSDHCAGSAGKTDLPIERYRIPCFIYSPSIIKPKVEQRLTSQIDLGPTVLGLLNMSYKTRFMGYDMNKVKSGMERAFVSTYQDLGYLKEDTLVILSPKKKVQMFKVSPQGQTKISVPSTTNLVKEAIAWYQGASYLFKNGEYKATY